MHIYFFNNSINNLKILQFNYFYGNSGKIDAYIITFFSICIISDCGK